MTCWRTRFRSAPSFTSTCAATPPPSRMAEQDVLGACVVVAELHRLGQGQLEHLLGRGRKRDVAGRGVLALADDLLDLLPDRVQADPQRLG
jgi:hypothetical protein